ncbi:hypothetical protein MtrunA17_Chr2g0286631 [Medicago truncatula]|uniref:Uncharacterized protein n=1 Tax=Medicago truncatula TaxID=3880 RepID=G7IFK8_MEDTR|nr:hypothetical protein MTR_2g020580 [Medicago truncatula]RHN72343.1 hypothetical protein MtrunA17_Chr2g0286631 [Medicago truncatula]
MNDMDVSCSSLLLIEDSADSEGDLIGFFTLYPAANYIGHKEEDAESCTYECDIDDMYDLVKEDDNDKGSHEFCCVDCSCSCSSSTMWLSDAALEIECSSSPLLVDDDDEEIRMVNVNVNVNDVDDKLFWEICMEVGYP